MAQGDRFYTSKEYNMAFLAYTEALEIEKKNKNKIKRNSRLKILYSKRSLTCYKLANYKKSLEDANCAIKFHLKGHEEINAELKILRSFIIENFMKTDVALNNIAEDSETFLFNPLNINENIIINSYFCDHNNESYDSNVSATLEDLLESSDASSYEEFSIQECLNVLSRIDSDEPMEVDEEHDRPSDIQMKDESDLSKNQTEQTL